MIGTFEPISDIEFEIRHAAIAASNGVPADRLPYYPHRYERSDREDAYLSAVYHFLSGRQCAGWDAIELGDSLRPFTSR